jgi:hypothetical protein
MVSDIRIEGSKVQGSEVQGYVVSKFSNSSTLKLFTLNEGGLTNIHSTSLTHTVEQEISVDICRQSLTIECLNSAP